MDIDDFHGISRLVRIKLCCLLLISLIRSCNGSMDRSLVLSRLETSYLKDFLTGQRFVAVKDDFFKTSFSSR